MEIPGAPTLFRELEKTLVHSVVEQRLRPFPQGGGAVSDAGVPVEHAIGSNAVLLPTSSLRVIVVKLGYETVQSRSESRFNRLPGLELVPQRPEFFSLIGRKQSEQAIRCGTFTRNLVERTHCI